MAEQKLKKKKTEGTGGKKTELSRRAGKKTEKEVTTAGKKKGQKKNKTAQKGDINVRRSYGGRRGESCA